MLDVFLVGGEDIPYRLLKAQINLLGEQGLLCLSAQITGGPV